MSINRSKLNLGICTYTYNKYTWQKNVGIFLKNKTSVMKMGLKTGICDFVIALFICTLTKHSILLDNPSIKISDETSWIIRWRTMQSLNILIQISFQHLPSGLRNTTWQTRTGSARNTSADFIFLNAALSLRSFYNDIQRSRIFQIVLEFKFWQGYQIYPASLVFICI